MLYNLNLSSLYKIHPNMGHNLQINSDAVCFNWFNFLQKKKNCTELHLRARYSPLKIVYKINKYKLFTTQEWNKI